MCVEERVDFVGEGGPSPWTEVEGGGGGMKGRSEGRPAAAAFPPSPSPDPPSPSLAVGTPVSEAFGSVESEGVSSGSRWAEDEGGVLSRSST